MSKTLHIKPNLCIGCKNCEMACAVAHSKNNKLGATRIKVYTKGDEKFIPYICLQCVDAACTQVCPTEAIQLNKKVGCVEINENACIKCGACQIACPFGNIYVSHKYSTVYKCDLCHGNPACARFCPSHALEAVN